MERERIFINDIQFDLGGQESKFAKTLQVNDLVSLENRQTNLTKNIKLPKTPKNILAMGFLGVAGTGSNLPYQKNVVHYFVGNEAIIYSGTGMIESTDNFYNINVYDGNIDLYKAIDNKTLADLDLTALAHSKNLSTVLSSFTSTTLPYKYIIADYNGKMKFTASSQTYINIDYLVPSVKVSYLWDKLFERFGFTYTGSIFSSSDFTNLWLTYPKAIETDLGKLTVFNATAAQIDKTPQKEAHRVRMTGYTTLVSSAVTVSTVSGSYEPFTFPQDCTVDIEIKTSSMWSTGVTFDTYWDWVGIYMEKNGVRTFIKNANQSGDKYGDGGYGLNVFTLSKMNFNAGDVVKFYLLRPPLSPNPAGNTSFNPYTNTSNVFDVGFVKGMKIEKYNVPPVTFDDVLNAFTVKEFLNEILWRFGLTPIKDKYSNNYEFKTLAELTTGADVIDWSDKFQEVVTEKYLYGSYAQKNNMKYKYNDTNALYNDGAIYIDNMNLQDNKTVIQSKAYSPEKLKTSKIVGGIITVVNVNTYKIWDKQVKDDGTVDYKSLDNRFYFMRKTDMDFGFLFGIKVGSESLGTLASPQTVPVESFNRLTFQEICDLYYGDFKRVLDKSKLLTVKLNLTYVDISNFDFTKLYFFKQLGNHYLVNKINNFQIGQLTQVELIKVDLQ